jgi:transcriptional regulator with XRE-family HTH domain
MSTKKRAIPPLATWLQATLTKKGMTQGELVRTSGLSKGHINQLYRGLDNGNVRVHTIVSLATGLGIDSVKVFKATLPA